MVIAMILVQQQVALLLDNYTLTTIESLAVAAVHG
jgi:predicted transcriptional regulator